MQTLNTIILFWAAITTSVSLIYMWKYRLAAKMCDEWSDIHDACEDSNKKIVAAKDGLIDALKESIDTYKALIDEQSKLIEESHERERQLNDMADVRLSEIEGFLENGVWESGSHHDKV